MLISSDIDRKKYDEDRRRLSPRRKRQCLRVEHQWKSIGLYEHPAEHMAGTFGNIVLSTVGVYALRVGGSTMSCQQEWAAKIHHDEGDEKESAIIIRNVPESIRRAMKAKAAIEGKSMQAVILELITKYIQ